MYAHAGEDGVPLDEPKFYHEDRIRNVADADEVRLKNYGFIYGGVYEGHPERLIVKMSSEPSRYVVQS